MRKRGPVGKRHHDEKIHSGMQTNIFGIFFGIFKASEDPRSMMRKRARGQTSS